MTDAPGLTETAPLMTEICNCNHPGGSSPKGVHLDQGPEQGHGRCVFKGCACTQFTWNRFEEVV